ncbi:hypothetical protein PMIN04_006071 [Paraphaeosphaeria minitans]
MNPTYTERIDSQGRIVTCSLFDFGTEDLRAGSSRRGSISSLEEDDPIKDWSKLHSKHTRSLQQESSAGGRIYGTVSPQPRPTLPQSFLTEQAEALALPPSLPPPPSAGIMARLNARPDLVYYPNRPELYSRDSTDQLHQPTINFRGPKTSYGDPAWMLNEIQRTKNLLRTAGLSLPGIREHQEDDSGTESNDMDTLPAPVGLHAFEEQRNSVAAGRALAANNPPMHHKHSRRGDLTKLGYVAVSEVSTAADDELDHELDLRRSPRGNNNKKKKKKKMEDASTAATPTKRLAKCQRGMMMKFVAHKKTDNSAAQSSLDVARKDKLVVRLWSRLCR